MGHFIQPNHLSIQKISVMKINVQDLKLFICACTFEKNVPFWEIQYGGSNMPSRSDKHHMQNVTFSCLNLYWSSIGSKMITSRSKFFRIADYEFVKIRYVLTHILYHISTVINLFERTFKNHYLLKISDKICFILRLT